jgi:predicted enzyme related to lactoylglutathione lyase
MKKHPRAGAANVAGMKITLSHCFIAVHDHDAALAFYRDALGLEIRLDVKYEGMRWVTMGPKEQPDVSIVLEPPLADPNASQADRKVMSELLAKGLLRGVNFATDNCDATFEHIRASGAEVMQEPMDQAYGVRDCSFRDPSGNMIRFSQKK